MEIGQKFNTLTLKEYIFYIDNYKNYTDFNTLGLYRSIIENEKLDLNAQIEVRDYAHRTFKKTFDFLQLKDPGIFVEVSTLGQVLTEADREQLWTEVKKNQQRILAVKRIKHRNYGVYAKHNCGYDTCVWNGLMIRQGTWLSESNMHFDGDRNRYTAGDQSRKRKQNRKNKNILIRKELENE